MLQRTSAGVALDGDLGDANLARLTDCPLASVSLKARAVLLDQPALATQDGAQVSRSQGAREDVAR